MANFYTPLHISHFLLAIWTLKNLAPCFRDEELTSIP